MFHIDSNRLIEWFLYRFWKKSTLKRIIFELSCSFLWHS
ncbi:hypothetical protein VIBHAR_05414 [Vibrio campbellii ATCC BAA-1116]|uniref:Uncharacterized protein n=1 Tax=Vibrio campbellii (strain ATCC BAA-1116) TaxID=2902295 RepID=A7N3T6_VIBC1|nr:hypothetical protein VIBHAR_05414 [Vibrio campbellii ATCC BAA-1116]